jgi:hypothetical protein
MNIQHRTLNVEHRIKKQIFNKNFCYLSPTNLMLPSKFQFKIRCYTLEAYPFKQRHTPNPLPCAQTCGIQYHGEWQARRWLGLNKILFLG